MKQDQQSQPGASMNTGTEIVLTRAAALVEFARECGVVLTIETHARQPLAMGYYDMVVGVRPARNTIQHLPSDDTEGGAA